MPAVREVRLTVVDDQGREHGVLVISLLPRTDAENLLLDERDDPGRDPTLEPVQVVEGAEYRYEFDLPGIPPSVEITTDREVFQPDRPDGRTGRLRPGLHVGMLPVTIMVDGVRLGRVALEVRSAKLDYQNHYRWMLRDIAETLAEIVMERFGATEQRFTLEETREPATLYQRFAFLKGLITGEQFEAAIRQILSYPHRTWEEETELRRPGRGIPAGSYVSRQISRPGPREAWPGGPVPYLPERMKVRRTEETLDTPENRFIKHVLTYWRDVAAEVGRTLSAEKPSAPVERGLREVQDVVDRLDQILSSAIFREVGRMVLFPAGSQVLQKRAGYRDLFRAFLQSEAAASLTWAGGEDVYSAGQRNVAVLYEYWVFLQLAQIVSDLCDAPLDWESLYEQQGDGLGVVLKRRRASVLQGVTTRLGRRICISLHFNKTFGRGAEDGSWTRMMRPDCSLHIYPHKDDPAPFEPVWIHFDAKYRINQLDEVLGKPSATVEDEEDLPTEQEQSQEMGEAKADDLLKMHAYRDAIRRSAGAYVVYPGEQEQDFRTYHEILPGLGAFGLRPSEGGDAQGVGSLRKFLDDVLLHIASQATQHERGRFWMGQVYSTQPTPSVYAPAVPFLSKPPADTLVLLGYVRRDQIGWVRQHNLYNLRADGRIGSVGLSSRELAVEVIVLYGPGVENPEIWTVIGPPILKTNKQMIRLGYSNPRSEAYLCIPIVMVQDIPWPLLTNAHIRRIRERLAPTKVVGEPVVVTWLDLLNGLNE